MPDVRAGHHGDVVYVFEDSGFNTSPTDTTPKVFGGNTTMDTYEGSHQAVRVFNAGRSAAEIIEQLFDGAWSVSFNLTEPPWWLAAVFGQPTSTSLAGNLYEHVYTLTNGNDPVSLRLYTPTDGFNEYEVLGGAVVASVTVDQSPDGSPEVTVTGAYASEPTRQSTPSISIPNFAESTFSNRHAEVQADGSTVGRAQNTNLSLEAGTELVDEIGSENAVDFSPKTFAPDISFSKIRWVGETVDMLQSFKDATSAAVSLIYDNGQTGDAQYMVEWDVSGALPNQWSESGRNDPEADLVEELQHMAETASVTVTEDSATPPGV